MSELLPPAGDQPTPKPPIKRRGPNKAKPTAKPAAKAAPRAPLQAKPDVLLGNPSILPPEFKPRVDSEQEMLRGSARSEPMTPPRRDLPPDEVRARQARLPVDHSAEVAIRAEELRREEWRKAIEADEERRGPNRHRNPRLPLMAESQMFRAPEVAEIPDDAVVPKGHAPKWVGTKDTLSTGNESMMLIRSHQGFGYDYVRDTKGQVIVTEYGVLMSASYEDAARRQHHLTPQGSMKTEDSSERLREVADRENRRAGRRVVGVAELPDHRRRFSERLEVE